MGLSYESNAVFNMALPLPTTLGAHRILRGHCLAVSREWKNCHCGPVADVTDLAMTVFCFIEFAETVWDITIFHTNI